MQLGEFLKGLNLLQTYYSDPEGYHLGADHDVIYAYPTDKPLPIAQLSRMKELGWFQPEVEAGDGEWTPELYDPEEGWAAFV